MSIECDVCMGGDSGFAADAARARWTYAGSLTLEEGGPVLAAQGIVDCSGIGAFDSTAVAVLLALKRRAATEGRPVVFTGLPARLESLAALYDVEGILAA